MPLYVATETVRRGWTTLFEGDELQIEEDPEGKLFLTTRNATREPVSPWTFAAWDGDVIRDDYGRRGVPADLIERVVHQAGLL